MIPHFSRKRVITSVRPTSGGDGTGFDGLA